MKFTCVVWISLSCPPIHKRTCVLLPFPHTYVLLSQDFDDIDNTPIAKRTHVILPFPHTCVLLSPDFEDIDNTCAFWISLSCSPIVKSSIRLSGIVSQSDDYPVNIWNVFKWFKYLQNVFKTYLNSILWFSKHFQENVFAVTFYKHSIYKHFYWKVY